MGLQLPRRADLLITHGLCVICDDRGTIINDGAIAISGAKIEGVGPASDVERQFSAAETVDASGHIVMPGLINAHTHTPMVLFRGLSDDLPLVQWLARMRDAARQVIGPHAVRCASRLAYAEMIRAGTTTAVDMYYFPEMLAEAAIEAGFRLVTGPVFASSSGPDGIPASERAVRGREFMRTYGGRPLVVPCVMPHSPYDCSPEVLRLAQGLAAESGALLSTHLAETRDTSAPILERYGTTPLGLLDRLDMLSPRTILAHCVHLTPGDIDLLAERGASVAHCPLSNLKLGDGIAPLATWLQRGLRVTLGTDGPASSNDLSLWSIMRLAAVLPRGVHEDPTLAPAADMVHAATRNAAAAIGLGSLLGSLEAGKLADLILVDLNSPHLVPLYEPYSHLVFAAGREDVDTVVIGGRIVMRERRLVTLDANELMADVRQITRAIGARGT